MAQRKTKSRRFEIVYRADRKAVPVLMMALSLVVLIGVLNYVNFDIEHGLGASAIIFASFGGSSFLLFMAPHTEGGNVKRFVKSYIIAGIMGSLGFVALPYIGIYVASAVIIPATALILGKFDSVHSPSISLTFAFLIYNIGVVGILIVAVAIVVLVAIRMFLEKAVFALERKAVEIARKERLL